MNRSFECPVCKGEKAGALPICTDCYFKIPARTREALNKIDSETSLRLLYFAALVRSQAPLEGILISRGRLSRIEKREMKSFIIRFLGRSELIKRGIRVSDQRH